MRFSFDPQQAFLIGKDSHLPAVSPAQLSPLALRDRFKAPPTWQPEKQADSIHRSHHASAAVLVPILMHDSPTVLFTKRTSHLKAHAGQISFPGGRREATDSTATETALREALEEIQLDSSQVDVLGELPTYITITGFIVTPIVGLVSVPVKLEPDPGEVAEIFEVPLAYLMDPANHERRSLSATDLALESSSDQVDFFAMPWCTSSDNGSAKDYFIWGATAAIVRNFYRFLIA